MHSVMLRVSVRCRDTLRELAAHTGESMQSMVDEAVELYRRKRFLEEVNAAYMPLRQNAETWRAVEQERSEWDTVLGDGLPEKKARVRSEHGSRERKKKTQTSRPR